MKNKIVLLMSSLIFSMILMLSASDVQASTETLYPDYIKDKELATSLVNSGDFDSINEVLTQSQFQDKAEDVTSLYMYATGEETISNLEGLEYFTNLQLLIITDLDDSITSIPPQIGHLTNLVSLTIKSTNISKIDNLENLTNLTYLDLSSNDISKIEGLENLSNLTRLTLDSNNISKIEGLENLTNLKSLSIGRNNISEIDDLSNLINLSALTLSFNELENLDEIDNLVNLKFLNLSSNNIENMDGIENLTKLESLLLSDNNISEVKGISSLNNLNTLTLNANKLTSIGNPQDYYGIETVDLGSNYIIDIGGSYLDLRDNIGAIRLSNQYHIEYLPKSENYDEVFKANNCQNSSCDLDSGVFFLNDDEAYIDKIDSSFLDEDNSYTLSYSNPDDLGYGNYLFWIDITIKSEEEINANDATDKLEEAVKNENDLLTKLQANSTDYLGKDNSDIIYISELDGYDYSKPQVGIYNIELSFKNENDYVFSTLVTYEVTYADSSIHSDDASVTISQAPISEMELYKKLNLGGTDRFGNTVTAEDSINYDVTIDNMDGYDFSNVEDGSYEITIMATTINGDEIKTTSTLKVMDDVQVTNENTIKDTGLKYKVDVLLLILLLISVTMYMKIKFYNT